MLTYLVSPTCWVLTLGSLTATILLTPFAIRLAHKVGAIDQGGYRKINGRTVPRMGGVAIAIPFLLICFLGIFRQPTQMLAMMAGREKDFLLLLLGGGAIAGLGMIDDAHELRARWKFLFQIGVALMVVLAGKGVTSMQLPLVGLVHFNGLTGALVTILWIVGVMNAFNLVDGLDGLATGLGVIAALGLGAVAAINGQTFSVMLCLGLAGSLAGFLVFNFHPARVFLGDTGSLFIGFTLAMLALMGSSKASGSVLLLAPMLALGFPIFDTLTSMGRRMLRGRSPFVGDRAHTHHRLLDYGYNQRQVSLILYGVAIMCTTSAVLSQAYYPNDKKPLLAVGLYTLVIGAVAWANGYLRLRHFMRVALCRARNNKLANFTRYASQTLNDPDGALDIEELLRLACREMNLKYLEIGVTDESAVIAGYYGLAGSREKVGPGPGEVIRVRSAEGDFLVIRYQLWQAPGQLHPADLDATETAKLERQDIMACLAQLFAGMSIERLNGGGQDGRYGNGKVAAIQEMSRFIPQPVTALRAMKVEAAK